MERRKGTRNLIKTRLYQACINLENDERNVYKRAIQIFNILKPSNIRKYLNKRDEKLLQKHVEPERKIQVKRIVQDAFDDEEGSLEAATAKAEWKKGFDIKALKYFSQIEETFMELEVFQSQTFLKGPNDLQNKLIAI